VLFQIEVKLKCVKLVGNKTTRLGMIERDLPPLSVGKTAYTSVRSLAVSIPSTDACQLVIKYPDLDDVARFSIWSKCWKIVNT
jgi:hypothetical protein